MRTFVMMMTAVVMVSTAAPAMAAPMLAEDLFVFVDGAYELVEFPCSFRSFFHCF